MGSSTSLPVGAGRSADVDSVRPRRVREIEHEPVRQDSRITVELAVLTETRGPDRSPRYGTVISRGSAMATTGVPVVLDASL